MLFTLWSTEMYQGETMLAPKTSLLLSNRAATNRQKNLKTSATLKTAVTSTLLWFKDQGAIVSRTWNKLNISLTVPGIETKHIKFTDQTCIPNVSYFTDWSLPRDAPPPGLYEHDGTGTHWIRGTLPFTCSGCRLKCDGHFVSRSSSVYAFLAQRWEGRRYDLDDKTNSAANAHDIAARTETNDDK